MNSVQGTNKTKIMYSVIILIWLLYMTLSWLTPVSLSAERYHLNFLQIKFLGLAVSLPLLIIWLVTTYAAVQLKQYINSIQSAPELKYYQHLYCGIVILIIGLIVPSFLSFITSFNPASALIAEVMTIIRNYLTIVVNFVAFWQIYLGAKGLMKSLIQEKQPSGYQLVSYILFAVIIIIYSFVVFNNPSRTISVDPLIKPTYYLPDLLILFTIMLPYVVIWFMGSKAVTNIITVAKNIKGSIYKSAFNNIAVGLISLIVISIGLQLLAQASSFFSTASLNIILIIVGVLEACMLVGYIMIARGAKKLAQIEAI